MLISFILWTLCLPHKQQNIFERTYIVFPFALANGASKEWHAVIVQPSTHQAVVLSPQHGVVTRSGNIRKHNSLFEVCTGSLIYCVKASVDISLQRVQKIMGHESRARRKAEVPVSNGGGDRHFGNMIFRPERLQADLSKVSEVSPAQYIIKASSLLLCCVTSSV